MSSSFNYTHDTDSYIGHISFEIVAEMTKKHVLVGKNKPFGTGYHSVKTKITGLKYHPTLQCYEDTVREDQKKISWVALITNSDLKYYTFHIRI